MATPHTIRQCGLDILSAGIQAVDPVHLVTHSVNVVDEYLCVLGQTFHKSQLDRLIVVGAGKAAAAMALGFEKALEGSVFESILSGSVNIPDGPHPELSHIVANQSRPAGVNEPTTRAIENTQRILELTSQATERDLIVCLLSGGASALLTAPPSQIGLEAKVALIRLLSGSGASINELNTVRRHLSNIKGGGLLNNCHAKAFVTLVISDVIGDPPEIIGSGPTIPSKTSSIDALDILQKYQVHEHGDFSKIIHYLKQQADSYHSSDDTTISPSHSYHIIGNIHSAINASADFAGKLGFRVIDSHRLLTGPAEQAGYHLQHAAQELKLAATREQMPFAFITGGETTVIVPQDGRPHLGGRNQQIALAALLAGHPDRLDEIAIFSIGTDGEDGPTNAAGGIADKLALENSSRLNLNLAEALESCNAYEALRKIDSLILTGPSGTNVMDLQLILAFPEHAVPA